MITLTPNELKALVYCAIETLYDNKKVSPHHRAKYEQKFVEINDWVFHTKWDNNDEKCITIEEIPF